jgi:hypothetical protein
LDKGNNLRFGSLYKRWVSVLREEGTVRIGELHGGAQGPILHVGGIVPVAVVTVAWKLPPWALQEEPVG